MTCTLFSRYVYTYTIKTDLWQTRHEWQLHPNAPFNAVLENLGGSLVYNGELLFDEAKVSAITGSHWHPLDPVWPVSVLQLNVSYIEGLKVCECYRYTCILVS